MVYQVLDRNGNVIARTKIEKIARRLVSDNPERSYLLVRIAGGSAALCRSVARFGSGSV
jgi:hypothetical protein